MPCTQWERYSDGFGVGSVPEGGEQRAAPIPTKLLELMTEEGISSHSRKLNDLFRYAQVPYTLYLTLTLILHALYFTLYTLYFILARLTILRTVGPAEGHAPNTGLVPAPQDHGRPVRGH